MISRRMLPSRTAASFVLDAFLGSGTTVIAAERVGRRCYGLELDPVASDRCFDDLADEAEAADAA
jgi:DNA modification methylase